METVIPVPDFSKQITQISLIHESKDEMAFKDFGSPTTHKKISSVKPKFQLLENMNSTIKNDILKDKSEVSALPIHPYFFRDLNVRISISNPELKAKAESILQKLGSKIIRSSSQIPDAIIIEDTTKEAQIKSIQMEKRISTRYSGYSRVTKMPKLISYEQLPGFPTTSKLDDTKQVNVEKSKQKKSSEKEFIEILDIQGKYRPISGHIKPTVLDLKQTPKCYFFSPFTKVPDDPEEYVQKVNEARKKKLEKENGNEINIIDEKSKKGYCAICNKNFVNADEHRCSYLHKSNSCNSSIFRSLDELTSEINFL